MPTCGWVFGPAQHAGKEAATVLLLRLLLQTDWGAALPSPYSSPCRQSRAALPPPVQGAEAVCLAWRPSAPQLLVGSARGGAVVYDCASRVATPLHVRASKPACTAAWVDGNDGAGRSLVAVGFRDQHVAWLDPGSGALLRLVSLRGVPADLQPWVPPDGGPALLAASVGGRSLLVWQLPLAALPGEPLAGVGAGAGAAPLHTC